MMTTHRMRASNISTTAIVGSMILGLLTAFAAPSSAYERPGEITRVSVASDGSQATNLTNEYHKNSISGTGRFVAFASDAPNLVLGDTNLLSDVFMHDRQTGETELVSISTMGVQAVGVGTEPSLKTVLSWAPVMSSNGRYVAFASYASNLVSGDTNLTSDIFVHDRKLKRTERISVATDGTETNDRSFAAAISRDGRFVAFESEATNLDRDEDEELDVYLHDRTTGETRWVSVSEQLDPTSSPVGFAFESAGILPSFCPSIDDSGRFVSFMSLKEDLVANDGNLTIDTFIRDMKKGITERVSIPTDGNPGTPGMNDGGQFEACGGFAHTDEGGGAMSADARYVAFRGAPKNLVPNDRNQRFDVYVHDRQTGRTERISVTSAGEEGDDDSEAPYITPDGRYVVFNSWAGNFVSKDLVDTRPGCENPMVAACRHNSNPDVFIHDRVTGATVLVSRALDGTTADPPSDVDLLNGIYSFHYGAIAPNVSENGRLISFFSDTNDLVEGDTNEYAPGARMGDIFVRDMGRELGVGTLLTSGNLRIAGSDSLSESGALGGLDPISDLNDILTDRGANLYGTSLAYRPQYNDLFIRIQLEDMPYGHGNSLAGDPSILYGLDLTANGTHYQIRSQRFASDSIEGLDPVQLSMGGASFGLFRCNDDTPLCTKVATLKGGYGTTGVEVVVSLPLSDIDLQTGGELNGLEAFTALGSYDLGAAKTLDTMALPN